MNNFTIPENIKKRIIGLSEEIAVNWYSDIINTLDEQNIISPPEQLFYAHWEIYQQLNYVVPKIYLILQHQIDKYYVDFYLDFIGFYVNEMIIPPSLNDREVFKGIDQDCPKIVIEIDSHVWHEKTPEQAEKDKQRERYIISKGYTFVRFTGREVVRNPEKCVEEVFVNYYKKAQKIYRNYIKGKYFEEGWSKK